MKCFRVGYIDAKLLRRRNGLGPVKMLKFTKSIMGDKTLLRYGLIGVGNTFVGFGLIFFLMYLGMVAEISNAIGYVVGIFLSYFLNRNLNFKSGNRHAEDLPRFLVSMAVAYVCNLLVLVLFHRYLKFNAYFSQIVAGVVYTLVGYILSKCWVFKVSAVSTR